MFWKFTKTARYNTQNFIGLVFFLFGIEVSGYGQNISLNGTAGDNLSIPVLFVENVGQLEDMLGDPVSNVLFTAQMPGMQVFITKTGITFLTLEKQNPIKGKMSERITQWERIDMLLVGANIYSENIVKTFSNNTFYHFYNTQKPDGIHTSPINKILIKEIYPGID